MKTLTVEQFNSLQFSFSVDSASSEFENHPIVDGIDPETGDETYKDCFESWVAGFCTANYEGITITFSWIANGGQDSYQDAHDFGIEIEPDSKFVVEGGMTLVDEDGDAIIGWELDNAFREKFNGEEWELFVGHLLPAIETNDIDTDEASDMDTFTIEIDNEPSIRFTGELVASASSSDNQAMGSSYSGQTGRWTVLNLYKTQGGKYICQQIGRTRWQGERDRHTGKVCESIAEVVAFFGNRWLAKELYAEAGIDSVIEVD
jgi:hypothetical protein